jgi:trehalose-phosphatase
MVLTPPAPRAVAAARERAEEHARRRDSDSRRVRGAADPSADGPASAATADDATRAAGRAEAGAAEGSDLGGELALRQREAARLAEPLPNALLREQLVLISEKIARCWTPAFMLDYDGTLAPMVADPAAARLAPGTKELLHKLADRHPTAIVSGRSLEKLHQWVGTDVGLYFAASHGFEIVGPQGSQLHKTVAPELLPPIHEALDTLRETLRAIPGVMLEDNKFTLSVHTRNVSESDMAALERLLDTALEEEPLLRRSEGKHVVELRPQLLWHKGCAVEWLLKSMCQQMGLPSGVAERNATAMAIYIGDDTTDEDAFRELSNGRGVPIIVRDEAPTRGETAAELWLRDPAEVIQFLSLFVGEGQQGAAQGAAQGLRFEGGAEGGGWRGVPYRAPRGEDEEDDED